MTDLSVLALRQRGCDALERLPTNHWPIFSTSLVCHIAALGTSCTVDFEAERDTLFTDMSISVTETDTPGTEVGASVSVEWCNTVLVDHVNVNEFDYCCQRKPIFLAYVREGKHLRITVTLAAAADEDNTVEVTLSGIQGNNCCG